jgi:antitoxin component of MazEF toxin-antitoxin module
MRRRLFRAGNSAVISLSKEILDALGIAIGKEVFLELNCQQRRLIITPVEKSLAIAGIDEDFSRQVNEFIEQYRPALEELAK